MDFTYTPYFTDIHTSLLIINSNQANTCIFNLLTKQTRSTDNIFNTLFNFRFNENEASKVVLH